MNDEFDKFSIFDRGSPIISEPRWAVGAKNWMHKNMPTCPFCKKTSKWQLKLERKLVNRYHFRCPNCLSIVSISVPATTLFAVFSDKTFTVENSLLQDFIGSKLSLSRLQEMAKKP